MLRKLLCSLGKHAFIIMETNEGRANNEPIKNKYNCRFCSATEIRSLNKFNEDIIKSK